MSRHLHIVCFDVPYPPDYGGVYVLFYDIKHLYDAGIKIHLHCFEYGRGHQDELNKYCFEVNYYKRKTGLFGLSFKLPYIVSSRQSKALKKKLLKDEYPVLMEGIHTTYLLYDGSLKNRKTFVRLHNVEHEYYQQLALSERSLFRKTYFLTESLLLKKYEKRICNKSTFIALTPKDKAIYGKIGCKDVRYLPLLTPFDKVESKKGMGDFCLYHGNLSISENEKASEWLIKRVFKGLNLQLIIAGKNPSRKLIELVHATHNTTLISNPGPTEMEKLVSMAQVNILPSFNTTGVKVKILNALYTGRHCIVNSNAVQDTELANCCHIANDAKTAIQIVKDLIKKEFTEKDITDRERILSEHYNNNQNVQSLIALIYQHYL